MTWSAPIERTRSHVARAADAGHLGAERLRDLHREGADPARGAVDQDLLPGLDLAVIAQGLQRRRSRPSATVAACSKVRLAGLAPATVLGHGRVLGERAVAPAEDLIARPEPRHARADGLDRARHIRPADRRSSAGAARRPGAAMYGRPLMIAQSAGLTPAARTRTSTSSLPIAGCRPRGPRGRRSSRTGPGRWPAWLVSCCTIRCKVVRTGLYGVKSSRVNPPDSQHDRTRRR